MTKQELDLISKIARRAEQLADKIGAEIETNVLMMDLELVHNSVGLKLEALLAADDGTFGHDIFGIYHNLDRKTGTLSGIFLPRLAA